MDDAGWQTLYLSALEETKKLKKQVRVLEEILRTHIPIVEANIIKKKNDK